ncbi:transposase, IS4 family [Phaeobacter porticola]|uniref:Transposase, IS4 family n=1 Tax=Phaeobacter porticola TaxID=1844006 RepID=A0A1L3I5J4_9RHOB|nr:transposase, IS4 family [Phaeobacter porticola]
MPCRAVDGTGIKFLGDGEWQARKHGVQGRANHCPVLPDLLGQVPKGEDIGTVIASLGDA